MVLIYLIAASLAFLIPEQAIPHLGYTDRLYYAEFPQYYVAVLLTLWSLATLPWLWRVYQKRPDASIPWLVIPLLITAVFGALVRPPITHDVYYCMALGRQLVVHWVSPYQVELWASVNDPVIGSIAKTWFHQKALYGPLALGLFAIPNFIGPSWSALQLGAALKLIFLAPYAVLGRVLWQRWRTYPLRAVMILAVLGNPVFLFLTFVEGHVDIFMLVFLALAGWSLEKIDGFRSALYLCGAACIKFSAIVVTPICFCWLWYKNKRESGLFLASFLLLYGAIEAMIGFEDFRNAMELVKTTRNLSFAAVVPRIIFTLGVGDPNVLPRICDLVFYLCIAGLCLSLLRGWSAKSPFCAIALGLAALCFTRTYFQPWYTLWFWPLLWLGSERPRTTLVSIAIWTVTMLTYHTYTMALHPRNNDRHRPAMHR